jgi:hypothetical protein
VQSLLARIHPVGVHLNWQILPHGAGVVDVVDVVVVQLIGGE